MHFVRCCIFKATWYVYICRLSRPKPSLEGSPEYSSEDLVANDLSENDVADDDEDDDAGNDTWLVELVSVFLTEELKKLRKAFSSYYKSEYIIYAAYWTPANCRVGVYRMTVSFRALHIFWQLLHVLVIFLLSCLALLPKSQFHFLKFFK